MQYRYVVTPFLLIENTRTHTHAHTQPMQLDRSVLFNSIILQRAFWKPMGGFMAGMSGVVFNCPGDVVRTVVQKKGFE